jgi:Fe-S-cluster-containing dehydrogenase component
MSLVVKKWASLKSLNNPMSVLLIRGHKLAKHLRIEYLERCVGCYQCVLACARFNEKVLSVDRASINVKTVGGYGKSGFAVVVCRGCLQPPCVPVCPIEGAIRKREKGGGVLVTRSICDAVKCEHECLVACPIPGAIHIDEDLNNAIICRQCGLCTGFCPTGVLIMEEPIKES